jgi:hypothetical protein
MTSGWELGKLHPYLMGLQLLHWTSLISSRRIEQSLIMLLLPCPSGLSHCVSRLPRMSGNSSIASQKCKKCITCVLPSLAVLFNSQEFWEGFYSAGFRETTLPSPLLWKLSYPLSFQGVFACFFFPPARFDLSFHILLYSYFRYQVAIYC